MIQGATVHTVSNGDMQNSDILFENGKIISIGHKQDFPPETEIIDATDQHVFPGLISAGSTLGLQEIG
ncbi:uncharacterized protein METZ01_LOCUS150663, partial [marine metagenome]